MIILEPLHIRCVISPNFMQCCKILTPSPRVHVTLQVTCIRAGAESVNQEASNLRSVLVGWVCCSACTLAGFAHALCVSLCAVAGHVSSMSAPYAVITNSQCFVCLIWISDA